MAVGETRITGLLEGQDVLDTASAMQALGAQVTQHGPGEWSVHGVGVGGFSSPADVIDCGNSGTGVRLIMGAVATTPISVTFTGDASLSRRPMARVTDPLSQFGTQITAREGGRLPITIQGAADPVPVTYRTPVASAQIKSAILLAGLNVPGDTVVIESEPTRDHSERMLAGFGAQIRTETTPDGHKITLTGRPELRPQPVAVPRDPSSAAFPVAAALIVPGSEIRVPGVSHNPTRDGLYVTLLEMGADITFENPREEGGEPVADLLVRHGPLKGVTVPARSCGQHDRRIPDPVGDRRVRRRHHGDERRRGTARQGKRPDRRDGRGPARERRVTVETRATLWRPFTGAAQVAGGGHAVTHLDHRIAMSFLILGLATQQPVTIDDAGPITTSFPDFVPLMTRLGATLD